MSNIENMFPQFAKRLEDLIEDEEGNIPGNKLLMLGTMIIILGSILSLEAFAKHRSHSSHRSHTSHSSHRSGSHSSHSSHSSHYSHVSHTSHSNTSSHSNSLYSAEGDVKYNAPSISKVSKVSVPVIANDNTFELPEIEDALRINENFETPSGTPVSGIGQGFAVPSDGAEVKIDAGDLNVPSATGDVR